MDSRRRIKVITRDRGGRTRPRGGGPAAVGGGSVRARDTSGRATLVAAAYGNHLGTAEALMEAGADVNAEDHTEQSAYMISTSEVDNDPRLLRLTLKDGADVGSLDSYDGTGFIRAADRGHVRIVEGPLETDVDVDHVNSLGWTAPPESITLGEGDAPYTEVVRLLVEEDCAEHPREARPEENPACSVSWKEPYPTSTRSGGHATSPSRTIRTGHGERCAKEIYAGFCIRTSGASLPRAPVE